MKFLDSVNTILVAPSHPGNIGATARALKTMGLSKLRLVAPKKYPDPEANQRSAGAEDLLEAAQVFDGVAAAVSDTTLILGTSVRDREVNWPLLTPREASEKVINHLSSSSSNRVAILFGRENSGLSNEELDLCAAQIRIPANSEYSSLNLGSAVQIIAYELRQAALINLQAQQSNVVMKPRQEPATQAQRAGHMEHLEEILKQLKFAHNENSPLLMRKLTRLYNKAELTVEEIQILRGILTAIGSQSSRS